MCFQWTIPIQWSSRRVRVIEVHLGIVLVPRVIFCVHPIFVRVLVRIWEVVEVLTIVHPLEVLCSFMRTHLTLNAVL